MEKEKIAELFMKGIDCSQVVAGAFAEELGITQEEAYKMVAGFGGGMGIGETCGAVVGAMIVLGLKFGHCDTEHMEQKDIMNAKRAEFLTKFQEKYGVWRVTHLSIWKSYSETAGISFYKRIFFHQLIHDRCFCLCNSVSICSVI